ncbi:MAG: glutamate--tRNA ligase [Bacillota bacterium]|nr:glutamate--tRNA ligase [Bacillota bacterium]
MLRLVRVRFAPSPTGELHIGGARTALFNWLFARHHGGKFVLRIEDTDVRRSRDELVRPMLEAFRWLGLDWDEGPEVGGPYGPYFQSQRLDLYAAHAERLLQSGHAYRCCCTPEELEERRKEALARGLPPRYDRRCRDLTPAQQEALLREGRRPVLRLKVPLDGVTVVRDLVRGDVAFEHAVLDDWVLVKSDGMPTYNFACVVDDATMHITHVIRAEEHLSNTPKQVLLYRALGYDLPQFAHVPMILAPDRSKLSKRHGATAVHEYRERGYLPDALVNYLATLGWSPEGGQEIITREEMICQFSLERVSRSAAIYDNEKLTWMNAQYLRMASPARLVDWALPFWHRAGLLPASSLVEGPARAVPEVTPHVRRWLEGIMEVMRERVRILAEVPEATRYFFTGDFTYDEKGVAKHFARPGVADLLQAAVERLRALTEWDVASVEHCYRSLAEERGISAGQIIHPTRLALTGRTVGPGLFDIMALLGREETVRRLERAVAWIRTHPPAGTQP